MSEHGLMQRDGFGDPRTSIVPQSPAAARHIRAHNGGFDGDETAHIGPIGGTRDARPRLAVRSGVGRVRD
jgi:hypothetical protein